jgi:hypothetical protein
MRAVGHMGEDEMTSTWREIVIVEATYYSAGQYPWPHIVADAGDVVYSQYTPDEIAANSDTDGDDWWADKGLWWFPGVGEYFDERKAFIKEIPDTDEQIKLITDAVHFRTIAPYRAGSSEAYDDSHGLIRHDIDNAGLRYMFTPYVHDMKRFCDLVRKPDHHSVTALIVFECEAGFSYIPGEIDEWDSNWQPIGLLDLKTLTITELPTEDAR